MRLDRVIVDKTLTGWVCLQSPDVRSGMVGMANRG